MKIARDRKSSVLASNAVHHRIDSLTSIVALLTIGGAHVITDASWLDPVGGLIIAAMVIKAGWGNTVNALLELGDVSVDQEIKEKVRRTVTKALRGDASVGLAGVEHGSAIEIKDVQGIKSGQNYLIDIELVAPSSLTLQELNAIEDAVRERAGAKVRGVRRVRVKFMPSDRAKEAATDFIPADVSPRSSPEPEDEHDHDHSHEHTNGHGHSHEHKKQR
jgi:divalent metal cation (Fe/Co/Zn/Cd) transporter